MNGTWKTAMAAGGQQGNESPMVSFQNTCAGRDFKDNVFVGNGLSSVDNAAAVDNA